MKNKITQLVRKNIRSLVPYSSARAEYKAKEGVFLDANENPYGTYNRYPDPYQTELKERIAEIKGCNVQQIFIGNGSDEVIDIAFRIFCEPYQDKALTFTPTYGMYEVSANINAVELIEVPLNEEFQLDRATVSPFLTDEKLKLIFVCSPNNPTGNLIQMEDIEYLLRNFQGIVMVDEAYIDFCEQSSLIEQLDQYPNLIVIQTLSKAWGMAGVRVGLAFMSRDILSYYNKLKSPYNVSTLNQKMALEVLNNRPLFEQQLADILLQRERLLHELKSLSIVKKIYPTDSNFVLIEVQDADLLYNRLVEAHIIVRNRNSVVANCLRITVGTENENNRLITALKEISNG